MGNIYILLILNASLQNLRPIEEKMKISNIHCVANIFSKRYVTNPSKTSFRIWNSGYWNIVAKSIPRTAIMNNVTMNKEDIATKYPVNKLFFICLLGNISNVKIGKIL